VLTDNYKDCIYISLQQCCLNRVRQIRGVVMVTETRG